MKRQLDIVILSDLHLGTYHCHAKELYDYLSHIEPKTLILNGDILDSTHYRKRYFPRQHMEIIQLILQLAVQGTKVCYVTGNHDDVLRRFSNMSLGKISIRDKVILRIKGKTYWIFHGDIFDARLWVSPILSFLGKKGYDVLLRLNRLDYLWRKRRGKQRKSLSSTIKSNVKKAQYYIDRFEHKAMELAARQNYDAVITGHIHQPTIKKETINGKEILYMNSGDWVENLTALEYRHNEWQLYEYDELDYQLENPKLSVQKGKNTKDNSFELPEWFRSDSEVDEWLNHPEE